MEEIRGPKNEINRRSFLKILGIATACTIIQSPLELLTDKVYKVRYLKIVEQMQNDTEMLKSFIKYYALELSGNDPLWETKTTIEIGYDGNDFVRNLKTVILRYAS